VIPFHIVDVFAEARYAGNQLAVVRDAGGLTAQEMQRIARETNFSETTFVMSGSPVDGMYPVRIFTPTEEVPFAGHPTLGTAYIIQQELIREPVETVLLNLKVGPIPVQFSYAGGRPDLLWMKQRNPEFGVEFERDRLSAVLSLAPAVLDERFPVQEVSTGLPFIIVPLKTLAAVRQARVDLRAYYELVNRIEAKGILIFCPEAYEQGHQLNVRMFADFYGVPEDPATGSANGCLAAYLTRHSYFGSGGIDVRAEQGYEIGRPSLLYLRTEPTAAGMCVFVGGRVMPVARGEFVQTTWRQRDS
jgi:trans-2,3-dihydro-3-hydroxyanthranilate isomerase